MILFTRLSLTPSLLKPPPSHTIHKITNPNHSIEPFIILYVFRDGKMDCIKGS